MTNDIFTKKTPLVLAVGAALSLGVQTAWAADEEPTHHALTLGDGKNNTFHSVIDSEESSITLPDDFQDYFNDQAQDDDGKWAKGDVIDVKGVTGTSTIDSVTIKTNGSLTIGSNVGALVFDKATVKNINIEGGTFSNGSVTYLEGASLTATGGTFKNTGTLKVGIDYVPVTSGDDAAGEEEVTLNGDSLTMKVGGTTAFTNSGTIELGDGVNFDLEFKNPTSSQAGDGENADKYTAGSFDNSKGKIVVGTGTFTIAASTVKEGEPEKEVVYDEKPDDLPTYSMGTIIVNGGKLVNENTGYLVVGEKENEDDENVPDPVRNTLVDFGDVTLNNGAFENVENARETGGTLTLRGENASVSIAKNAVSEWDAVVINHAAPDTEVTAQDTNPKGISVAAKGELTIGAITLQNLAKLETEGQEEGKAPNLAEYITVATDGSDKGSVTVTDSITIKNLRDTAAEGAADRTFYVSAKTLKASLIDIAGASLSIENTIDLADTDGQKRNSFSWETYKEDSQDEKPSVDLTKNSIFKEVKTGDVATLDITGYDATWTANDDEDKKETDPAGEWTLASIGEVSAKGTSKINLHDIRTTSEDESADPKTPTYTANVSSISLSETWYNATADVQKNHIEAPEDFEGATTDEGYVEETYNKVIEEVTSFIKPTTVQKLENTIDSSDLNIGTLSISKPAETIDLSDDFETSDGYEIPKDEDGKTLETVTVSTGDVQHTAVTLNITDSRLRIGEFSQATGTVNIGGKTTSGQVSEVIIDSVSKMDGEFTFNGGLLALNANSIDRDELLGFFGKADTANEEAELTTLANTDKLLYIGSTVTFGENARVGFGTSAPTGETLADDDEADDAAQTGSKVVIDAGTTIAFNARVFNSNGLLAGTGDGATLVFNVDPNEVDGKKIKLVSENTSVGAFNLTQGFTIADKNGNVLDGDEATGEILNYFDASGVSIDAAWGLTGDNLVYVNDKGQIIIGDTNEDGKVTTADFSLLSDVAAKGLVDDVLAGNRTNETADRYLINRLLMNVHQKKDDSDTIADYSVSEAVREINSMTQFAAVSALKAMTVDFSGYVQDQIEHHAYTIPHEMRGWWVQPIGARLKTDDLRAGNLTTGYSLDTYGIMGGYDWTVPNGDIWGIAASYQSGDADGEGNALAMTSDVSATSFHIWAARHIGDLRVMGAFTYMKSDADATMSTSLGSLSSDELAATAVSFGMRADLTKTYGNFKLVPHAGARVSMVDMDDFTVTYQNTYEAFKYSEDKAWIFEVPVGVTAATSFEYQRWNVQPYVDLTVRGRFGDTDATTTVTGVGSGVSDKVKYDVSGDVIGDLRVGYMSTFQNLNLGMSYGFSAGDAGRQNHTFEATLRIDL